MGASLAKQCAVKRRWTSAGATPARELFRFTQKAIEAAAEATKLYRAILQK
jgi:hypothetical protein